MALAVKQADNNSSLTMQKGGRTRGKQVYLGGYVDEVAAARAYDRAAIAYWPDNPTLNVRFLWQSTWPSVSWDAGWDGAVVAYCHPTLMCACCLWQPAHRCALYCVWKCCMVIQCLQVRWEELCPAPTELT